VPELRITCEVPDQNDSVDAGSHLLLLLFLDVGCDHCILARRGGRRYGPNGTPLDPTCRHVTHDRVVLVGNLTRDPELRHTPSGTPVCSLRLAVNTRRKDESGQWTDKPNYFDITVWGQQGENCAQYLSKGRPVAIDGRLEWREWEAQDGSKRQAVEVVAESVQFLGGRQDSEAAAYVPAGATAGGGEDFPTSPADDDIPF
jgi:single-strand DNA-binding protein